MSAKIDGITIGGIEINPEVGASFSQSYLNRRISTDHYMGDGSIIRQTLAGTNGKLATRIEGSGWAPLGLESIDTTVKQVIKCGAPLSISGASTSITIPSARRSDSGYTPLGFAVVSGGIVPTTISMTDDDATLGAVTGATSYYVTYVPEITAWVDIESQSLDSSDGKYSFVITGIEG